MKIKGLVTLALLLAFGGIGVTPASATTPTPVTITVLADFSGQVPQGTFTAGSPLCSSGTFVTEPIAAGGGPAASAFTGLQHFSCDDVSGTFTLEFHPQVHPPDFIDHGPWAALGGTGAYDAPRERRFHVARLPLADHCSGDVHR